MTLATTSTFKLFFTCHSRILYNLIYVHLTFMYPLMFTLRHQHNNRITTSTSFILSTRPHATPQPTVHNENELEFFISQKYLILNCFFSLSKHNLSSQYSCVRAIIVRKTGLCIEEVLFVMYKCFDPWQYQSLNDRTKRANLQINIEMEYK